MGDLGRVGHCAWIGREPERAASEHLAAYREGYSDALLWALEHDHHEIEAVLDDPE